MSFVKKIICLALLIALIASLVGCDDTVNDGTHTFTVVEKATYWTIVYHNETKVMYVVSDSSHNYTRGVFTVLVNADGTPMIYDN